MKKRLTWASVLLRSLALLPLLAGCSSPETPLPGTSKLLDALPRVENSSKAPCWMQEQVAAQNSYLASIKAGKEIAYAAPCRADQPKVAQAKGR